MADVAVLGLAFGSLHQSDATSSKAVIAYRQDRHAEASSRYVVVFTGSDRMAPTVFYQLINDESYRVLKRFLDRHPAWEVSADWTRARFQGYLRERKQDGLPFLHFRETRKGWMRVNHQGQQHLVSTFKEENLFTPQVS